MVEARDQATSSLNIVNAGNNRVNLIVGFLTVIFALFWLIALIDRIILPFITRSAVELIMPDLRMMTFAQADSVCKSKKTDLLPARVRAEDKIPPGLVVDQYPTAGSIIKPGRRVEVVVSSNSGLAACPDVTGKSLREAVLIADSSGLWLNSDATKYRFSNTDPEGVIIDQTPFAFTGLMKGSEMRITISLGPAPENPVVPDLIGVNIDNVALMLRKMGLRLGNVIKYPDRNRFPGTVIEQSRQPGEPAVENDVVDVRIAIQPVVTLEEVGDSLTAPQDAANEGEYQHE